MKLTGENRSTRGKTCPSATLSTTNPTLTDPGSNPDLREERPEIILLSHGTAQPVSVALDLLYCLKSQAEKERYVWTCRLLKNDVMVQCH